MNRLWKVFAVLLFVFLSAQTSYAEEYNVLVLPDTIQFERTNYLVFPDSATVFASDTINEIKKDGRVQTVSMTEVRDTLRKKQRIANLTKKALKEFKYNYNIPFVDFKEIANCFSTDKVLIITSQTDTQNFILRRSFWDIINLPGEGVIDPAYKLSTYVALIDVSKEQVLWQKTYYKTIRACEGRMVTQNFAPTTEQLEKIKTYSTLLLTPEIARTVEAKILPPPILNPQNGNIVNVSDIKSNEDMTKEAVMLKPKTQPARPSVNLGPNSNGVIINEL